MKKILSKKFLFAICYGIFLVFFSVFVVLDAMVIEKGKKEVEHNPSFIEERDEEKVIVEENKYEDNNIKILLSYDRYCDSDIYIADITLSDSKFFRTAFAQDKYGKNIIDTTSNIAQNNNAIFAVNGDYYGFRDYGFVLKNGIDYRSSARPTGKDDVLIYYSDGDMKVTNERVTTISKEINYAKESNCEISHIFSFGPALVVDSEIVPLSNPEDIDVIVNPRTAVGMIEPLHYIFVCVDGRSEESVGITIEQLAEYMKNLNCNLAYNLDGGSSTTIYFNGKVLNKPSAQIERPVSDIVYIGY